MTEVRLHQYPDPQAMALAVAQRLEALVTATDTPFRLVLAGGTTPEPLYRLLAGPVWRPRLPWPRIVLLQGDERFVAPHDPAANQAMIRRTLLAGFAAGQGPRFHPMVRDGESLEEARDRYQALVAGLADQEGRFFDLVLLGVGEDGHTASLFAGDPALEAGPGQWVAVVPRPVGRPPVPRLTLTLPALARAGQVFFLATGPVKAALARRAAAGQQAFPAAMVRCQGGVSWFVAND